MRVPMLDLQPQLDQLGDEMKRAVAEVIDSRRYILGPVVERFERSIADYVGSAHGIGVSSGTDALVVCMMALGIGTGDIVITPDYSFFATAGAVARLNATPAFVDIEPETYNICPRALEQWFDQAPEKRTRVKAIVVVHLFGQCADMKPILELADRYDVPLIEDAAQAIGALYPLNERKRSAGSMGLAGCFSFFPSKNLGGIGDGGLVVTDDEEFAEQLRLLRNHGAKQKYYHSMVGGNFRLDPIQSAAIQVKLPYLEDWHALRRERAAYYDRQLMRVPGLRTPRAVYGRSCHIYNQYVVEVADRRNDLIEYLESVGISTAIYYPLAFHQQQCFQNLGYQPGDFPRSEYAAQHTIALPTYPDLTRTMQDHVIESISEFYG